MFIFFGQIKGWLHEMPGGAMTRLKAVP